MLSIVYETIRSRVKEYPISNINPKTTNNIISLVLWQVELTSLVPSYTWLYMVTRLKLSDWIIVWTNEMIWLRFDLKGDHLDICCGLIGLILVKSICLPRFKLNVNIRYQKTFLMELLSTIGTVSQSILSTFYNLQCYLSFSCLFICFCLLSCICWPW